MRLGSTRSKLLIILLGVAVFAAACGGGSEPPTPVPPTATPESAAPLGWARIEGDGVALWLPLDYAGGDPSGDDQDVLNTIHNLAPQFEQTINDMRSRGAGIILAAFDVRASSPTLLTNMIVVRFQGEEAITPEQYLQLVLASPPPATETLQSGVGRVNTYPAARLVREQRIFGPPIRQVTYAVFRDMNIWVITYSTPADEFETRLPTFEQSVQTFEILS